MRYQFPEIRHLDDVRQAIEGRDEFIIAERDWGFVVNYMVTMPDTFPPINTILIANGDEQMRGESNGPVFETNDDYLAALRRECRGLLFYPDGKIMSRRLHKFHNVNERAETQHDLIDLNQPHVILEKLDGSMITPVVTESGLRWGTKMGLTEVSMQAEEFVARNPDYREFAEFAIGAGYTPIFEWCSRKQRIVVDYREDRLVLIAVRNTISGEYVSYEGLKNLVGPFNIELVKAFQGTVDNMEHLIQQTKPLKGREGWVVRFADGHMIKIKADEYVKIHKIKDNLLQEKNVVDLIVNEKMDDAKAFMLDDDRRRVEDFESNFWAGIANSVANYDRYFATVMRQGLDRKRYALEWMPTIKDNDRFASGIVFGRFDGKDTRQMVLDQIAKHTGSQTKVDEARSLWGGARWTYQFDGDA